ncbi:MAG TPA: hypothetical protein VFH11_00850 [Gemmatimonadota bacterium]|nr:hypothetical protein [Gemmatimonadota bacterium]
MDRLAACLFSFSFVLGIGACQKFGTGPESPVGLGSERSLETALTCEEPQFVEVFTDVSHARIESVLLELGFGDKDQPGYVVHPTSQLAVGISPETDIVIIPTNSSGSPATAANVNASQAQANLLAFVETGGVLVMHDADVTIFRAPNYRPPSLTPLSSFGPHTNLLTLADAHHPMAVGPDGTIGSGDDWTGTNIQVQGSICCFVAGYLPPLPLDAQVILASSGQPVLVEYPIKLGRVILTSVVVEGGNSGDPGISGGSGMPRRVLLNELFYAATQGLEKTGDDEPPVASAVAATPNPVQAGTVTRLAAVISDGGCEASGVGAGDYSVDGGPFVPMTAVDGDFGQGLEAVEATLSFPQSGIHEICVRGTDLDGNTSTGPSTTCTLLAVFDPAAGFVTGAGLIQSPLGAFAADPDLADIARFAFVSRYRPGRTVPDGTTRFTFRTADLEFMSSSYEWLVVAGARAQFKGIGTINGVGDFGFMLTAIDGEIPGGGGADRFRIKIWDHTNDDSIVYDNQMGASDTESSGTTLKGGSISIQTN